VTIAVVVEPRCAAAVRVDDEVIGDVAAEVEQRDTRFGRHVNESDGDLSPARPGRQTQRAGDEAQ
jgi:hypothetical protein